MHLRHFFPGSSDDLPYHEHAVSLPSLSSGQVARGAVGRGKECR